jgi:hypothetical protein
MNDIARTDAMDAETLEALRGSIKKWEGVIAGTVEEQGSANCPLCQRFVDGQCRGCPVMQSTGQKYCQGSPYHSYVDAEEDEDDDGMAEQAKNELDFLKSLLPPGVES